MKSMLRSHKFNLAVFCLAVLGFMGRSLAAERAPIDSIPTRFLSAESYGFGVISRGAVVKSINGRAQLFSYEIDYDKGRVKVCMGRALQLGQKVLFSISSKILLNRDCPSGSRYVSEDQFSQFIYPGFDDLFAEDVFYEIPPGVSEKFGCSSVTIFSVSSEINGRQGAGMRALGLLGLKKYFSGKSLVACMRKNGFPLSKGVLGGDGADK